MKPFGISERDIEPGRRVLTLTGELDLAVSGRLQDALDRAGDCDEVLLEMGECDFIDSTGIAVVVRDHIAREKAGRRLVACAPSEQVLRVFEMTGLTDQGLVFDSVGDALAA